MPAAFSARQRYVPPSSRVAYRTATERASGNDTRRSGVGTRRRPARRHVTAGAGTPLTTHVSRTVAPTSTTLAPVTSWIVGATASDRDMVTPSIRHSCHDSQASKFKSYSASSNVSIYYCLFFSYFLEYKVEILITITLKYQFPKQL